MKKKTFYGWYIVAATHVICMIGYATWIYCFGVFFRPMASDFGWSSTATAGAYSLRSLCAGLAAPMVGWAVDKYGPRIVVFVGGIIGGFGFVLMYSVKSLLGLYLVYGVLTSIGMCAILYMPAMAIIANWFIRRRSRALALLTAGAGIGGLWIPPLVAGLITRYGWRWTCVIIGVTIWATVLPLSLILKRRPEDVGLLPDGDSPEDMQGDVPLAVESEADHGASTSHKEVDWTLRQAISSRTFWILAFAFFLSSLAHSTVTVHAVNSLKDAGMSEVRASFYGVSLFALMSLIGRLGIGALGDFFPKRYLLMVSFSLSGMGVLVLGSATDAPTAILYSALFGIGFGGIIPLNPAIRGEYFGRAAFAKIQGFTAPIMMIGGMTGPLLAGVLYDARESYTLGFTIVAVLQFLAAFTIFFAKPTQPPQQPLPEAIETE